MRFQIMCDDKTPGRPGFRQFFETDDIQEAKAFAMQLAFIETNTVYVQDSAEGRPVMDFDDPKYRKN